MTFSPTTPPTAQELATAVDLPVFDREGNEVKLGQLLQNDKGKAVVIFIRQDYISYLTMHLPPALLASSSTKLSVVGCGDWKLAGPYKDNLDTPFEVYADPSKKTYEALGMTLRTLDMGSEKPAYVRQGMFWNALGSIVTAFKMKRVTTPAGDIKQLGGEFVFGPGMEPVYTHRMENTRGHAPLEALLQAIGVPSQGSV
ncbi:hypothetical protein JCM10207_004740 [Rhodosporidiobolus poonsookiae]